MSGKPSPAEREASPNSPNPFEYILTFLFLSRLQAPPHTVYTYKRQATRPTNRSTPEAPKPSVTQSKKSARSRSHRQTFPAHTRPRAAKEPHLRPACADRTRSPQPVGRLRRLGELMFRYGTLEVLYRKRFGQEACCFGLGRAGRGYLHQIRGVTIAVAGLCGDMGQVEAGWGSAACRDGADARRP